MSWVNASKEVPENGENVLIIGDYILLSLGEQPTKSGNIYCEATWDDERRRWDVNHPEFMKQVALGHGRVRYWTHLPQEE